MGTVRRRTRSRLAPEGGHRERRRPPCRTRPRRDPDRRAADLAAPAGLVSDVAAITGQAIGGSCASELFIFALIIPVFFFVVQIGALADVAERTLGIPSTPPSSYPSRSCSRPPARQGGNALVLDIAGYWDKLSLTPAHRSALVVGNLFGEMFAVLGYSLVLPLLGSRSRVRFEGNPIIGPLGLLALTLLFGIKVRLQSQPRRGPGRGCSRR